MIKIGQKFLQEVAQAKLIQNKTSKQKKREHIMENSGLKIWLLRKEKIIYLSLLDPVLLLTAKREQAWNSHYGTYVRGDESSLLEVYLELRRHIHRCQISKLLEVK